MKKILTTGAVAGSMLAGALFGSAVIGGIAGAQDDGAPDGEAPTTERETTEWSPRHHRGGPHGHLADVLETLGLDAETVRDGRQDGLTLLEIAEANGVGEAEVVEAMLAEAREHLDEKVAEGALTREQADERLAELESRIPELLRSEPGDRPFGGPGHRGPGARLDEVTDLLGIDAETLRAELESGATLAEVAEANGVGEDALVAALVADVTERLDEKVAEGDLTQEEADERLAEITERVMARVNGEVPEGLDEGPRGRLGGGPGGGSGDSVDVPSVDLGA